MDSIDSIRGLPTRANDPNGPRGISVQRWRGKVLQVTVFKQEALDRLKMLKLPKAYVIHKCTSALGDGKLYVDMFFKLEQWEDVKNALLRGGFKYEASMGGDAPTAHMGYFSL